MVELITSAFDKLRSSYIGNVGMRVLMKRCGKNEDGLVR